MEKQCSKCKELKDVTCFNLDKTRKDGLSHRCKDCQKSLAQGHYKYNHHAYKERNKKRRDLMFKRIEELKTKCSKCGDERKYVLDFHHIDDASKEYDVGHMSSYTWEKVELEISKCIILCSNCHRELHYFENLGY